MRAVRFLSFEAPSSVGMTVMGGAPNALPPIAAVHMQDPSAWRFAWPMSGGGVVLQSRPGGDRKLSHYPAVPARTGRDAAARSQLASQPIWLSGTGAGGRYRINFSRDGAMRCRRWTCGSST